MTQRYEPPKQSLAGRSAAAPAGNAPSGALTPGGRRTPLVRTPQGREQMGEDLNPCPSLPSVSSSASWTFSFGWHPRPVPLRVHTT